MIATITLGDVVRELVVFAVCLVAAIALNAYAIVHYQTRWSELYTDIGFTVSLALIIYTARCVAKGLITILWHGVRLLGRKMKR